MALIEKVEVKAEVGVLSVDLPLTSALAFLLSEELVGRSNKKAMKVSGDGRRNGPLVGIVGGSRTDFPFLEKAVDVLKTLGVRSELLVVSAHRTPDRLFTYAEEAPARGIEVIVAGAGGAAHLPGMLAAKTHLPVIGVPIPTENLRGLDSLLSIVQMPKGIPVATVAIGGGENAGLLAAQILAGKYPDIAQRVLDFRAEQTRAAIASSPESSQHTRPR